MSVRLEVENLSFRYGRRRALGPVSFALAAGERVALVGPSGCGKTSLLRLLAGLVAPESGVIRMDGVEVSGPGWANAPQERGIGFVFQSAALWPHMTVAENLEFMLPRLAPMERNLRARSHLQAVGLADKETRYPDELSGGEAGRVAVLRALIAAPRLCLFDEPLAHLDEAAAATMLELIRRSLAASGATCLYVTHHGEEVRGFVSRTLRLTEGGVLAV